MRDLRFGSLVTALVVATVGVACSSSSDDASAPASADAAWSDTTSTLGVTSWAMVPSGDDSSTLTGYDDESAPRPYLYRSEVEQQQQAWRRTLSALPDFPATAGPEMRAAFDAFRDKTRAAKWAWNELPLPPSFADAPNFQYTVMAVEAAASRVSSTALETTSFLRSAFARSSDFDISFDDA